MPKGGTSMQAEGDAEQNIGYWTDAEASASWQFHIAVPGTYYVEAWVACTDPTTVKLSNGRQNISQKISSTGGYNKYKKISIGSIKLEHPGVNTIVLNADQNDWKPVNIRNIILKPDNYNQ